MHFIRASALFLMLVLTPTLLAFKLTNPFLYNRVNRNLHGTVVDYTNNSRVDNRIWSESLCEKRDLYVYLPPNYDSSKAYPLLIWLHGFSQDENVFLDYVVKPFDCAIASGKLPPMIIAAPDGSLNKQLKLIPPGSFFINSKAGKYEDYFMKDVVGFLTKNYLIRPEREAHGLAGTSMGGAASYHLGIKHHQFFKNIAGISPPLNLRYMDHKGSYMGDFSAAFTEFRTDFSKGHMTVGKFFGFFLVKAKDIQADLFNFKDPNIAAEIAAVNPTEMLDFYNIKNGMLNMYLAYGRKDEFNLDAQAESFLHHAQSKGIHVDVDYDPHGRHNTATAKRFIPNMIDWFAIQFKGMEPK
jgi:pimeloyl-ACP methyl ester carboxylesterase